VPKKKR